MIRKIGMAIVFIILIVGVICGIRGVFIKNEDVGKEFIGMYVSQGSQREYDLNYDKLRGMLTDSCELNLAVPVIKLNPKAHLRIERIECVSQGNEVMGFADIANELEENKILYFKFSMIGHKINSAEIKLYSTLQAEKYPW